jgi:hypothetical protein
MGQARLRRRVDVTPQVLQEGPQRRRADDRRHQGLLDEDCERSAERKRQQTCQCRPPRSGRVVIGLRSQPRRQVNHRKQQPGRRRQLAGQKFQVDDPGSVRRTERDQGLETRQTLPPEEQAGEAEDEEGVPRSLAQRLAVVGERPEQDAGDRNRTSNGEQPPRPGPDRQAQQDQGAVDADLEHGANVAEIECP